MIHLRLIGLTACAGLLWFGMVWSQEGDSAVSPAASSIETSAAQPAPEKAGVVQDNAGSDIVYKPVGYGELEVGQMGSGYFRYPGLSSSPISHVWQQRARIEFGGSAIYKNDLEVKIMGGGLMAYSAPQLGTDPQTMQTRQMFYLKMGYAAYSFGIPELLSCKAQVGLFPFKYNPNVKNLGEYLFRSNAYPLLIYADFDYPQADILGCRFNCEYKGAGEFLKIKNDLLLHSELYTVPVQAWSLSDVVSAKVLDAFTVGGGLSFVNLFSVYQGQYPSGDQSDWMDYKFSIPYKMISLDKKDTVEYNWKSTKAMVRMAADFKKLFPWFEFTKQNEFALYAEADIIGLKNFPQYDNLASRTFYTVGLTLPGFSIFDYINGEIEINSDSSAFSDEGLFPGSGAISLYPSALNNSLTLVPIKRDPLRLSFYIKKSFFNGHLNLIAQVARDHKKINFYYYLRTRMSFMESLPTKDNWWWVFKTEFNF